MNVNKKRKKKEAFSMPGWLLPFLTSVTAILLCFVRLPLTNRVNDSGSAYFSIGAEWFLFCLAFLAAGMYFGLSRLVTVRMEHGQTENVARTVRIALLFAGITGLLGSALLLTAADLLADFSGVGMGDLAIRAFSLAVFPMCLTAALMGALDGFGFAGSVSGGQLLFGLLWFAGMFFWPDLLADYGRNVGALLQNAAFEPAYGAMGSAFALALAAWISFFYSLIVWLLKKRELRAYLTAELSGKAEKSSYILRSLLSAMLPGTLLCVTVAAGLLGQDLLFQKTMAKLGAADPVSQWGIYTGKVRVILLLPLLWACSFALHQLPGLRLHFERRNLKRSREKCMLTLRCGALIFIPAAILTAILADPLLSLLSGGGQAGFLRMGCVNTLFLGMAVLLFGVLWSMDKKQIALLGLFGATAAKLLSAYLSFAVLQAGLQGVLISNLVFAIVLAGICIFAIRRQIHLRINWLRILLAPLIGGTLTAAVSAFLNYFLQKTATDLAAVLITVSVSAAFYMVTETVLHGLTPRELREFKSGQFWAGLLRRLRLL